MSEPAIALSTRDFRHAVMLAGKAVERRSTIPILEMVRCRANGSFEATGTNLDLTVTAKVERSGEVDAAFMLPDFRSVIGAVGAAGGADMSIDASGEQMQLRSDALCIGIKSQQHVDDFPTDHGITTETFAATFSHEQIQSLRRVSAAISTEETRYYLNGIYFHHLDGHTYRAVATDGHRLHWLDLQLPDAAGALKGAIIPRLALTVLFDIVGTRPGRDDRGIAVRIGTQALSNAAPTTTAPTDPRATRADFTLASGPARVTLATKLIDGTFPDYTRVVPTTPRFSMLFKSAELRRAVRALSFGSKHIRAVKIVPDAEGAVLSAQFLDTGIGTSVRIECTHNMRGWTGARLGYQGAYLLALVDAAGGDELLIAPTDEGMMASLVRNPADPAWGGVIMPVRV
ncbi:MAG TPA: hypothetical protein VKQ09_05840 [Sphingomonas sp.]|nr:hypothetical protein [Sphingomonas sp.]